MIVNKNGNQSVALALICLHMFTYLFIYDHKFFIRIFENLAPESHRS